MSRFGLAVIWMAHIEACSSTPAETPADSGADLGAETSNAAERCQSPSALASCAATYDEEAQAHGADCSPGFALQRGACGSHLIVMRSFGLLDQDACFYDGETKQLVGSEDCGDTNVACNGTANCEFGGTPIEPECENLGSLLDSLENICPQDGGADGS